MPVTWASLVAQMVKNLPAMQETLVWSLGWEDPLEEDMATHLPMDRGAWRAKDHGVAKSWTHNWATKHTAPVTEAHKNVWEDFIIFQGHAWCDRTQNTSCRK